MAGYPEVTIGSTKLLCIQESIRPLAVVSFGHGGQGEKGSGSVSQVQRARLISRMRGAV